MNIKLTRLEDQTPQYNKKIYPIDQKVFWDKIRSYVKKKYIL